MKAKVEEIRKALKNECYLSALALTLTLPDICSKIEYGPTSNRQHYIKWFDKHVGHYYAQGEFKKEVYEKLTFDGKACYALRCSYLHAGNSSEINNDKRFLVNNFSLCISGGVDAYGTTSNSWSDDVEYKIRLDIVRLCLNICSAVEAFYDCREDKSKFDIYTISVLDIINFNKK